MEAPGALPLHYQTPPSKSYFHVAAFTKQFHFPALSIIPPYRQFWNHIKIPIIFITSRLIVNSKSLLTRSDLCAVEAKEISIRKFPFLLHHINSIHNPIVWKPFFNFQELVWVEKLSQKKTFISFTDFYRLNGNRNWMCPLPNSEIEFIFFSHSTLGSIRIDFPRRIINSNVIALI